MTMSKGNHVDCGIKKKQNILIALVTGLSRKEHCKILKTTLNSKIPVSFLKALQFTLLVLSLMHKYIFQNIYIFHAFSFCLFGIQLM